MIQSDEQRAYEAYREARIEADPEAGKLMPHYQDLGPVMKPAWKAVVDTLKPTPIASDELVPVATGSPFDLHLLCDRYGLHNIGLPKEAFLAGVADFIQGKTENRYPEAPGSIAQWEGWRLGYNQAKAKLPAVVLRLRFFNLVDLVSTLEKSAAA